VKDIGARPASAGQGAGLALAGLGLGPGLFVHAICFELEQALSCDVAERLGHGGVAAADSLAVDHAFQVLVANEDQEEPPITKIEHLYHTYRPMQLKCHKNLTEGLHTLNGGVGIGYTQSVDDSVAVTLRTLKEQKKYSLEDLAELTSQSTMTVRRHLNGEIVPDRAKREKYARAFGISFDDFETMWQPSTAAIIAIVRDADQASVRLLADLVRRADLRRLLEKLDLADFGKLELTVREVTLSRVPARRAGKTRNK
jgi:transcriptional regulator with XRE-family HTH domain